MFGSNVLEIALGLTLIYTMFSLVCTAANELIASVLRLRAKNLADGIRNLLDDTSPPGPETARQAGKSKTSIGAAGSLAQQLYDHPLIQGFYRRGQTPSYIPSRMFALALMDIFVPSNQPRPTTIEGIQRAIDASTAPEGVKRALHVLTQDAANTLETGKELKAAGLVDVQKLDTALNQLQENIEVWFNSSMERVSGWYKQKTQALVFVLAITFTAALNVDTIQLVKRLSYDSALRQSLVAQAEKLAELPPAHFAALSQTGIPLGWSGGGRPADQDFWVWWLTKFFGLILTAGAASLGAPFWFDILNKIVTIRSAGKAPEEAPKQPKEIPRPVAPGQSQPGAPPPTTAGKPGAAGGGTAPASEP